MGLEKDILNSVVNYCKDSQIGNTAGLINQTKGMNCSPACAMNALIYLGVKSKKDALNDLESKFGDVINGMDSFALEEKITENYSDLVDAKARMFINNPKGVGLLTEALKSVCDGKAVIVYNSTQGRIGHSRLLTSIIREDNQLFALVKDPLSKGVDKVALEYIVKSIITPQTNIQYMGSDYTVIKRKSQT